MVLAGFVITLYGYMLLLSILLEYFRLLTV